ncbi:hypothetical protein MPSEU_000199100 [Mayamaea pseudoterrestris]|nr:hypothetical protein MPSEU_000199100 [Mayamaea pseudoterrestris]
MSVNMLNICRIILAFSWLLLPSASAQRFLKSDQMDKDLKNEMSYNSDEYNDSMSGMNREMFLMQKLKWEIEPPQLLATSQSLDPKLKQHIKKYLGSAPVELKLQSKKGQYGLRAVGLLENGKKLRAFWRQSPASARLKAGDFMKSSYDDAVRSRLFVVEFEMQLPPIGKSKVLPSVVYQVAVESGSMNPKAVITRGSGKVLLYPGGHDANLQRIEAGTCNVGVSMKAGLIDPNWARGRPFFRKGRSPGLI